MTQIMEKLSRHWQLRFLAVGAGIALMVYAVLLPDPGNKSSDDGILSVKAAPMSSSEPSKTGPSGNSSGDTSFHSAGRGQSGVGGSSWAMVNSQAVSQLRQLSDSEEDAALPRDFSETVHSLRAAAERGEALAQILLGHAYETGLGVPKDMSEAAHWYARAAESRGSSATAQPALKDVAQALDAYRQMADAGNRDAELYLGLSYDLGQDLPANPNQAAHWYRKAAMQGSASAAANLGVLYHNGDGLPKDAVEAANWFQNAANRGSAIAQYGLGRAYYKGDGVAQDFQAASGWLEKAANQGNAPAQVLLGLMCAAGQGVAESTPKAYMWINLASGHSEQARISREQLEKTIAPQEVAEGQRLTHDWLAGHRVALP